MPVRIKPIHNLDPCTLNLEGIKGICALIDKEFGHGSYAAEDDIWIVYDESSIPFLDIIDGRDRLDSFTVVAPPPPPESAIKIEARSIENLVIGSEKNFMGTPETIINVGEGVNKSNAEKTVKLVFSKDKAQVIFDIDPADKDWLDHFLLDLNKHIGPPSFLQRFGGFPIPILFVGGGAAVIPIEQPYCRIVLKPNQPNQRLIGIGDNIAANVIYDILKVAIGAIIGVFAAWLLSRYGVNILGIFGGSP